MNKDRTHQIDDLAVQFFRASLPVAWVVNEQHRDYGKDFLVEIAEETARGALTGNGFYVQVKGHEKPKRNTVGSYVKHSLEHKHAKYYLDRVKDLPVFLVVVDVTTKQGWWLFIQPILDADQSWRKRKTVTIKIPVANVLADTGGFRKAVEEAKKWMRLRHPESIHEAVVAQKQKLLDLDPRFNVEVSLINDQPMFTFLAKEEVSGTFTFLGDKKEVAGKISDLLDRGLAVSFEPGELKATGSKLFERVEEGCLIQAAVSFPGTMTLICRDADGRELARLSEIPGQISGGRKEAWFNGSLPNSPLSVKIGPLSVGMGGAIELSYKLQRWDGQRLLQLAYFDRLEAFFRELQRSDSTTVECHQDGNTFLSVALPLHKHIPTPAPSASLEILAKARQIAQRFGINPIWSVEACNADDLKTVAQAHAIFFGDGWRKPMPNVRITADCNRKGFRFDIVRRNKLPQSIFFTSDWVYTLLGEKLAVGRLRHEFTDMSIRILRSSDSSTKKRPATRGGKRQKERTTSTKVEVLFTGCDTTVMNVRPFDPTESGSKADELPLGLAKGLSSTGADEAPSKATRDN